MRQYTHRNEKPVFAMGVDEYRHQSARAYTLSDFLSRYYPPDVALGKNGKVRTRVPVSLA
jgi:hypothetical protein